MINMLYGNSFTGYGYSPNRSRDVNHNNLRSQFLGANGNRQTGYYYSPSSYSTSKPASADWYDGASRYHER